MRCKRSASSSKSMPRFFACSSLLPGDSPTTTAVVFLDTDAVTRPPASAMSFAASDRDRFGNVPVMTKVWPASAAPASVEVSSNVKP